ncbi:hypothetical protein BDW71DRAFT_81944 [Aspergillus fruticulosus]
MGLRLIESLDKQKSNHVMWKPSLGERDSTTYKLFWGDPTGLYSVIFNRFHYKHRFSRLIPWNSEEGGILRLLLRSEDWAGILLLSIFLFCVAFSPCALPCLALPCLALFMLQLHHNTFRVALLRLAAYHAMSLYLVHYWVANSTVVLRKWEALSVPSSCLCCAFWSVLYRYITYPGRLSDHNSSHHANLIPALFLHYCLLFFILWLSCSAVDLGSNILLGAPAASLGAYCTDGMNTQQRGVSLEVHFVQSRPLFGGLKIYNPVNLPSSFETSLGRKQNNSQSIHSNLSRGYIYINY